MKENLYLALKDPKIAYCDRIKDELKTLIDNFTKDTFEARFSMVEKFYASDFDFKDINTQLEYEKRNAKYEALAVEMAEKNSSPKILCELSITAKFIKLSHLVESLPVC